MSVSQVEPLPHQISAVYEEMLPRQPLRYVLADDPGAGKTIMAGLLIKELPILVSIIYGMGRRGSEFRATVSLLPRYREEIEVIQTHQFPLTSLHEAFACANDKKTGAIKVTVVPS